jgi:hypothetical protein
MSCRKRNRQSGLDAAELGVIKLADGESIADLLTARACSSCARGLPAAAQEWDLSGIHIDGQPVERETVTAWLGCVDSLLHHAADNTDSTPALTTAKGLQKLLCFADAVGSIDGVLHACLGKLPDLQFAAVVGEDEDTTELQTDGTVYFWKVTLHDERVISSAFGHRDIGDISAPVPKQQREQFVQAAAAQVEGLLFMAHKLHLQPLLAHLHTFLFNSLAPVHDNGYALLDGVTNLIFTERVYDAALGSGTLSKEQYLSTVLGRPCGLVHGLAHACLLKPVGDSVQMDNASKVIRFTAELQAPLMGCRAGQMVPVSLDLFNSSGTAISLGKPDMTLPAQLLVGFNISGLDDLQEMFYAD